MKFHEMSLPVMDGNRTPGMDGLYLVFVDSNLARGWTEPHIILRHNGKWLHRNSAIPYTDRIIAYVVLTPMTAKAIHEHFIDCENYTQEYDL